MLWVYGGSRSCSIHETCYTFSTATSRWRWRTLLDAPAIVAGWLVDARPVAWLGTRGVEVEPHAEVLADDRPRWHWLHVADRMADPLDSLAPLAPLVQALAASPIA